MAGHPVRDGGWLLEEAHSHSIYAVMVLWAYCKGREQNWFPFKMEGGQAPSPQ